MRIHVVVAACALVACVPDPPDRTKTCEHWSKVLDGCAPSVETTAETVGLCKGAFKGSPDHPVDKETARFWGRIRLLATCAEPLSLDGKGCLDYDKCIQQAKDLFPAPQQ